MADVKNFRNSTLMDFLCDENHRLLGVLHDLMGVEIPEEYDVNFLQIKTTANPMVVTHGCVVISGQAYVVIQDFAVLDDSQLNCYVDLCEHYAAMLERNNIEFSSLTPIVLSDTGVIAASRCVPYIPAYDIINDGVAQLACDDDCDDEFYGDDDYDDGYDEDDDCDDYDEDGDVDDMFDDDDDDDEALDFMESCFENCWQGAHDLGALHVYMAHTDWLKDEKCRQVARAVITPSLRKFRPEMTDADIDDALTPRKGAYIALVDDAEFYVFDIHTGMGPEYDDENYALQICEELYLYAEARMIFENAVFHRSAKENTVSIKEYLATEDDDEVRQHLKVPGHEEAFCEEILLTNYIMSQRMAAVKRYVRKASESFGVDGEIW